MVRVFAGQTHLTTLAYLGPARQGTKRCVLMRRSVSVSVPPSRCTRYARCRLTASLYPDAHALKPCRGARSL